jgi:non-specific serine/threonine protein kinase
LAIELAAARVKVLSPEQIAARLDDRFRLLMGGNRSVLPRQQTLKALIDWSYQLLSEPEQILFRRLSAFTGGWTLEAAEAVCSGEDIQIVDVLDLLTSLIEKSLIIKGEELGEARFKRLETIRQYARDKLQESGEEAAVRDRHKEWYLQFVEAAFDHLLRRGSDELTWLDKLETEHDNLRTALEWSLISHDIETAARFEEALVSFWDTRGYVTEARQWLKAVLNSDDPLSKKMRARILYRAAMLAERQGDYNEAIIFVRESSDLYEELGDQEGLTRSINGLGYVMLFSGDFENALPVLNETLALARQINNKGLV